MLMEVYIFITILETTLVAFIKVEYMHNVWPSISMCLQMTKKKKKYACVHSKKHKNQTSLVVQQLKLYTTNAGGPDSIPGQAARTHMPQLRVPM